MIDMATEIGTSVDLRQYFVCIVIIFATIERSVKSHPHFDYNYKAQRIEELLIL